MGRPFLPDQKITRLSLHGVGVQLIAATGQGITRLNQIADQLTEAARENVLAPVIAADNATAAWASLDLARKRASPPP